jgi:hypothetical protein
MGARVGENDVVTKQSNPSTARLDLETLVRRLHGSGIRVGIQTCDDSIQVWISDRLHRVRKERVFEPSIAKGMWGEDSVALWLHAAALQLFPDEAYARDFRTGMLEGSGDGRSDG